MDPASVIRSWSYLGIVVFLVLTGCGLPIPEEVPIIAAGVLSKNTLNPWLALASCFVGAVLGDIVMYGIGRKFGRRLLQSRGWLSNLISPERESEIEAHFQRHGLKVLFAARFLAGIRSPIYLTAGILKVPFRRFIVADLICAAIVIPIFFGVSYVFSDQIQNLWQWLRNAELAASVAVAAGALIAYFFYRRYRRRQEREALAQPVESPARNDKIEKSVA